MTGVLIPLPREDRAGNVRNSPFPPVRALDHVGNLPAVIRDESDGGEAA